MKKIGILGMVLLLCVGMVNATTEIWARIQATGNTMYSEQTLAGGINWQRQEDIYTGGWYVDTPPTRYDLGTYEAINNQGTFSLEKYLNAETRGEGSAWDIQEYKHISGSGETTINKEVQWTTNTKSVGADGLLEYPTVMKLDVQFTTPAPLYDYESMNSIANIPPAQIWNTFDKTIITNEPFNFVQRIGKNMDLLPALPVIPLP